MKFLVAKLGIEEFRRLVLEDRAGLTEDPRWTAFLDDVHEGHDGPLWQIEMHDKLTPTPQLEEWLGANVTQQRQPGYKVVMVYLPLGDITADQMRGLADVARRFTGDAVRMTVEQNMALRWVREATSPLCTRPWPSSLSRSRGRKHSPTLRLSRDRHVQARHLLLAGSGAHPHRAPGGAQRGIG